MNKRKPLQENATTTRPVEPSKIPAVGVVVPGFFIPPSDGGQRVCYDFCLSLAKRTRVICFSAHRERTLHGLNLIYLFFSSVRRYFNIFLILRLGRELKNNNVHCCIINQPFFVFSAYLACKFARCQLITYAHNLEFKRADGLRRFLKPFIFLIEFTAFHLSRRVFFISHSELIEAKEVFHLTSSRCVFVPHLVRDPVPTPPSRPPQETPFTLIFFGNFSYPPNRRGLNALFQHIVPLLGQRLAFPCRLIIFGGHIPKHLKSKRINKHLSIEVLGYIDNPANEIQHADILLSPVCEGTGVQTKIIEALSLGTTVISAKSGARGIGPEAVGDKLKCVGDNDWDGFVQMILDVKTNWLHLLQTPDSFFDTYSERFVMATVLSAIGSE